jgi:hypothetical protein
MQSRLVWKRGKKTAEELTVPIFRAWSKRCLKMEATISSIFTVPVYQLLCVIFKKKVLSLTEENVAVLHSVVTIYKVFRL